MVKELIDNEFGNDVDDDGVDNVALDIHNKDNDDNDDVENDDKAKC